MRKRRTRKKPEMPKCMSLKYSIRISGSVTSLTLRKNLVGMWLTLNSEEEIKIGPETKGILNGKVMRFIYQCLGDWEGESGKGFSDFVSDRMIKDILERPDYKKYYKIVCCV